ncbi:MAG: glycosyltransferase, partial [Acetatifactor sp.]|nr:glycosyltransferase [Acetatifactor sp.]
MKLSVIVPVYNMAAEGKLQFCLDSLVNQTISDYEIIAVDDASTDNSLEILQEYAGRYPEKVRVLAHEVNRRQGGAKNTGLKAATGKWVGFIDSDDWVTPDYYEKLLGRAEETGADMVGCDYSLVHSHTFEVGKVVRNNSREQTGVLDRERHGRLIMRSGSMVIKIYKRQVIEENHLDFPEGIFYEDNCAGPVWSLYFAHFERVEEPLYYYYQRPTSTVHHVSEEKCRDRMKAAQLMLQQCRESGFLDQYYSEIQYRFTELYYAVTLFSYM